MKEKTIYVATIIDSLNYGTVLQAAATNSLLSLYGNPIFIDYCRPDWKLSGWASIYMSDSSHSKAVNLIRLISNIPARIRSYYLFRSFIKSNRICSESRCIYELLRFKAAYKYLKVICKRLRCFCREDQISMIDRCYLAVLIIIVVVVVCNIPTIAGRRDKRLSVAKLYAIRKVKQKLVCFSTFTRDYGCYMQFRPPVLVLNHGPFTIIAGFISF